MCITPCKPCGYNLDTSRAGFEQITIGMPTISAQCVPGGYPGACSCPTLCKELQGRCYICFNFKFSSSLRPIALLVPASLFAIFCIIFQTASGYGHSCSSSKYVFIKFQQQPCVPKSSKLGNTFKPGTRVVQVSGYEQPRQKWRHTSASDAPNLLRTLQRSVFASYLKLPRLPAYA